MTAIHVLGIHGSPLAEGNTAHFLRHALGEVDGKEGVVTETLSLAGRNIADCTQCNWCVQRQTEDRPCVIQDDALPVLEKIQACHVLVLASPVYFGRLSGILACLVDRTRCLLFGRVRPMALRGKVGVALAVGWGRNSGIETTLASLHGAFLLHEMWTPSVHAAGMFGVGAVAGQRNADGTYRKSRLGVLEDREALRAAGLLVQRAVRTARRLQPPS